MEKWKSMKVGVNLLNFGPGATPDSLSRWTEIAETLGYHLVMISDHVAITPDVEGRYPAPFYDPFTSLSWLAGKTSRIALGTTVVIIPSLRPSVTRSSRSGMGDITWWLIMPRKVNPGKE